MIQMDKELGNYGFLSNKGYGTKEHERNLFKFGPSRVHRKTFNPIKIAFHEYWNILKDMLRTDISIKQKFFYLFAPPGWSHDGSRKMSTDIKKEFGSS